MVSFCLPTPDRVSQRNFEIFLMAQNYSQKLLQVSYNCKDKYLLVVEIYLCISFSTKLGLSQFLRIHFSQKGLNPL